MEERVEAFGVPIWIATASGSVTSATGIHDLDFDAGHSVAAMIFEFETHLGKSE